MEAAVLGGLFVLFVVAAPLAGVFAARSAHSASLRAQDAQRAQWHQVTAVLVADANAAAYGATAVAKWTAPGGGVRAGEIPVPAGSKAGTAVKVWVDASGRLTGSPMRHSDVTGNTVVAGVAAAAAVGVLLLSAGAVAHRAIGRKRMAAWDADWQATEPQWTHRR